MTAATATRAAQDAPDDLGTTSAPSGDLGARGGPSTAERRAARQWQPPTSLPALSSLLASMGPMPCSRCGSAMVDRPGVCDGCDEALTSAERRQAVRFARESILEGLRGRTLDGEAMARFAHPDALGAVRAMFGRPLPLGLALVGPSGAAKTSLACAILTRIHDRASEAKASSGLFELGRGALFVCASELATACEERRFKSDLPELLQMARGARLLVLDEVQAGGRVAWEVVQRRHNRGQRTIVTTWQGREELARTMGDGFARRVYEREIRCEKVTT